jgi:hypothetical protein
VEVEALRRADSPPKILPIFKIHRFRISKGNRPEGLIPERRKKNS